MAYRAAVLGRHPAAGVIALGGDIPPEVRARAETGRRDSALAGGTHRRRRS